MKKCAVINDLSGFGKCSLGVSLPIISVMGSEVHPLPTAVLSNQTAYDNYMQVDLTEYMQSYADKWRLNNASFDAILTGFVTNEAQLDFIEGFIDEFKSEGTIVIVDPVMADNGSLYKGYTYQMCEKIKTLCYKADIITPNIAELAFIAGKDYSEDYDTICNYAEGLIESGIKRIVVTGYKENDLISNIVFDEGKSVKISAKLIGGYFSGTGDITASIIAGGVLRGMSLVSSVRLATDFISKVIENTKSKSGNDGIDFERFLEDLL